MGHGRRYAAARRLTGAQVPCVAQFGAARYLGMVIIDRNNAHHGERDGKYAIKPKHTGNTAALGADVEDVADSPVLPPSPEDFDAMRDALRSEFSTGDGVEFQPTPNLPYGYTTPWGKVTGCRSLGPGFLEVDTAKSGGYKLSPERNRYVPAAFRQRGGWYKDEHTNIVFAAFSNDFARDRGLNADAARDSSLDALMRNRSRELEEITGLDIGGAYQRDRNRRFDEALSSPDAAERYRVVSGYSILPTSFPGYDWEVYEEESRTPPRRRFLLTDRELHALPSDYSGPNVSSNIAGRRIIDLVDPDGPREAPEGYFDLAELHWGSAFRDSGRSHVSRFADVERDTVSIGPGVVISPRADIRGGVTIRDGVYVGRGAYIDDNAGHVIVPSGFRAGDHARIRSKDHMVELSSPDGITASMHPIERADHTIGVGVTMNGSFGEYITYEVDDPDLHKKLNRLAGQSSEPPEHNWFTEENFGKLTADHRHWAEDPGLRSVPRNFASVVDLPRRKDDGAPLNIVRR